MMWIYCFISLTIFLILMIIYLFRHKRKKNISKPLRIIVWGTGILTLVLLAVSCFMPEDTQSNQSERANGIFPYIYCHKQW